MFSYPVSNLRECCPCFQLSFNLGVYGHNLKPCSSRGKKLSLSGYLYSLYASSFCDRYIVTSVSRWTQRANLACWLSVPSICCFATRILKTLGSDVQKGLSYTVKRNINIWYRVKTALHRSPTRTLGLWERINGDFTLFWLARSRGTQKSIPHR